MLKTRERGNAPLSKSISASLKARAILTVLMVAVIVVLVNFLAS